MNKRQKPGRRGAGSHALHHILSDKENEIIKKELDDPQAAVRNLPALQEQLRKHPSLRRILYHPFQMLAMAQTLESQMQSRASLSGRQIEHEEYYNQLIQQIAPHIQPQVVLDFLLAVAKQTKVKGIKRVLLWAAASVAISISSGQNPTESPVIRAIVLASLGNSLEIAQKVTDFVDGKEPHQFRYSTMLDDTFGDADWKKLLEDVKTIREDFFLSVSMRALELFERVKKPFGLRFFRLLHYPDCMKGAGQKLIVTPSEANAPQEDVSEDEKMQRLIEALRNDITNHNLTRIDREVAASIKTAAFGDIEFDKDPALINAAVFASHFPSEWNPFVLRLYRQSGEQAEKINPSDETNFIIDLKSQPQNADLWRRYGDLLYDKDEWGGAFNVYRHVKTLQDEYDESLNERLHDLEEKILSATKQEASIKPSD
ncbi:MAG: hypothetical protein P9L94_14250 [Candidatus Hinthialibacter antarcticus]|nr:hypothetical protein [Candidatus Hinthialibacter antarcticus]